MPKNEKKIAAAAIKRSEMAELVANGATIPEVAKLWGIRETSAYRIWGRIKEEMGWQAV